MTNEEIMSALSELVGDILDQPDLRLTREMTAEGVQDWDSVNHVNIVVATEMRFGVKFRTAELDEIHDVGSFVDLIAGKLSKT